jgi:MoxR-like ATPase
VSSWLIYRGTGEPHDGIAGLAPPPPWRTFHGGPVLPIPPEADGSAHSRLGDLRIASSYRPDPSAVELVNAALQLRRPLLVTGKPGTGKSSLAYSVAYELGLGPVLRWPITSKSALPEGLYSYDALGRLQDVNLSGGDRGAAGGPGVTGPRIDWDDSGDGEHDRAVTGQDSSIGDYVRLGPLGTALLPFSQPRVLLIDEIDKSDVDLPNDLLNLFEYPAYRLPELARIAERSPEVAVLTEDGNRVTVQNGEVMCHAFPFVLLTSNGEREFPPAFLRRCLRLELAMPSPEQLAGIVESHLGPELAAESQDLLDAFVNRRRDGDLAADQLLNAVYLTSFAAREHGDDRTRLAQLLMRHLDRPA